MAGTLGLVVLGLVVALLVYAATRPDDFRVERSASIAAPPERVFDLIDDLHAWRAWSPWDEKDPRMQQTHSGAERGVGAIYEWSGNKDVGQGRMEITGSEPGSRVTIRLDFLAPFEAHNTAEFTLAPDGTGTKVTWATFGPSPFMMKLMSLFTSFDDMMGKDFERGLARMKAAAEGG